jgi:hypothetical protein
MIPVLGDDGSASGPLCISLAIGLTVAWLFYHTDDNTNDRLPPQPADTTSTSATACTDSSVKVAESCTGMDIGRTVNDAFTNGSKWTASAVSYEEQDKAVRSHHTRTTRTTPLHTHHPRTHTHSSLPLPPLSPGVLDVWLSGDDWPRDAWAWLCECARARARVCVCVCVCVCTVPFTSPVARRLRSLMSLHRPPRPAPSLSFSLTCTARNCHFFTRLDFFTQRQEECMDTKWRSFGEECV